MTNSFKNLITISQTGSCFLFGCAACLIKADCSHIYISEAIHNMPQIREERKRVAKLKIKHLLGSFRE